MGVDELRPVCDLVFELRFQRIAGSVARLDIEIGQPFAHARIRQGGRNGLVQLSLDGVRNSSGSEESEPEAQVYVAVLTPASLSVGTFGRTGERSALVTASPLILPASMRPFATWIDAMLRATCPAITSFMAGPPPL